MCRYYCNGSTILPNPPYALCPIGHYCPEGSYEPTVCARGTITYGDGKQEQADCVPCPAGQYCTEDASREGKTRDCLEG